MLTTTATCRGYFQKTVTDPRGRSITTSNQAFVDPTGAIIPDIAAPATTSVLP